MQTHTKTKQRVPPAGPNDSDESVLCVRFVLMTCASVPGLGGRLCVLLITRPLEADWVICWLGHLPCVRLLNKTLPSRSHLCSRAFSYEWWQEKKNGRSWCTLKFSCSSLYYINIRLVLLFSASLCQNPLSPVFFIKAVKLECNVNAGLLCFLLKLDGNRYRKHFLSNKGMRPQTTQTSLN